jgi:hypothetical protein
MREYLDSEILRFVWGFAPNKPQNFGLSPPDFWEGQGVGLFFIIGPE